MKLKKVNLMFLSLSGLLVFTACEKEDENMLMLESLEASSTRTILTTTETDTNRYGNGGSENLDSLIRTRDITLYPYPIPDPDPTMETKTDSNSEPEPEPWKVKGGE